MYKSKIILNSEQQNICKVMWLQMFEEKIRQDRGVPIDIFQTMWWHLKQWDKKCEEMFSPEEQQKIKEFERKIDIELSFGNLIENYDIYGS